jgi:hypothetical protein
VQLQRGLPVARWRLRPPRQAHGQRHRTGAGLLNGPPGAGAQRCPAGAGAQNARAAAPPPRRGECRAGHRRPARPPSTAAARACASRRASAWGVLRLAELVDHPLNVSPIREHVEVRLSALTISEARKVRDDNLDGRLPFKMQRTRPEVVRGCAEKPAVRMEAVILERIRSYAVQMHGPSPAVGRHDRASGKRALLREGERF